MYLILINDKNTCAQTQVIKILKKGREVHNLRVTSICSYSHKYCFFYTTGVLHNRMRQERSQGAPPPHQR
jgi:hypothetical protein